MSDARGALVVLVEDEDDVRRLLEFNLRSAGYEVVDLADGLDATKTAAREGATLLIVDRNLPSRDGLEVCREVRSDPRLVDLGVLVLSARGTEQDRLDGLAAGADDYVVKPFSVRELLARVRVLTSAVEDRRRARGLTSEAGVIFRWRDLVIDTRNHRVLAGPLEFELRPLEFLLLVALVRSPDRVWSREDLLRALWGNEATPTRRTVDVHVRRLRERLGPLGEIIETVHGAGYRVRPE